jgi:hypothetical protein
MDAILHSDHSSSPLDESVSSLRRTRLEVEAPDRGDREAEAPESWGSHAAEAPDAGEGRMSASEDDFTLGRSQC